MPSWKNELSDADIGELVQLIKEQRDEYSLKRLRLIDKERLISLRHRIIHSELEAFRVELVAKSGKPTGLASLPDGRLLLTQENGELRLIGTRGTPSVPITSVPDCRPRDLFHRALLGVALHPDYRRNGWIYLTCGNTVQDEAGKSSTEVTLLRGHLRGGAWVESELLVHLPTDSTVAGPIAFDGRGHVFLTTASAAGLGTGPESKIPGDEPLTSAALMATPPQDLKDLHGKILRYDEDGSIPADNPFVGSPGAYAAIWSLGIRNAAALVFDPVKFQLWATDHGPRGGDKINLIHRGHNYGWPVISYGTRYDGVAFTRDTQRDGMDQPIVSWTPDIGISAFALYQGGLFRRWNRNLLVGSLATEQLIRIGLADDKPVVQEVLIDKLGRIRAIAIGRNGEIYIALELAQQGAVVRLLPVNDPGRASASPVGGESSRSTVRWAASFGE
jgi:glucose/arabinose dehydrogenase